MRTYVHHIDGEILISITFKSKRFERLIRYVERRVANQSFKYRPHISLQNIDSGKLILINN